MSDPLEAVIARIRALSSQAASRAELQLVSDAIFFLDNMRRSERCLNEVLEELDNRLKEKKSA